MYSCTHLICKQCVENQIKAHENLPKLIPLLYCPIQDCRGLINLEEANIQFPHLLKPLNLSTQTAECLICYNYFYPLPQDVKFFNCHHHFCLYCAKSYIRSNIHYNKILDIACPICNTALNECNISSYFDQNFYEMFKNIKRYALLLRNPTLKQCSNIKCAKIHKIVKNSRKLSCECGAITCLKCGLKYHRRKTCDKANDDLLKEYCKRTDTLPCPKCGILCQKAGGCKHMSCLICAYEWCFYCHGKYTQKHICAMN